jgi:hypothetical protein
LEVSSKEFNSVLFKQKGPGPINPHHKNLLATLCAANK